MADRIVGQFWAEGNGRRIWEKKGFVFRHRKRKWRRKKIRNQRLERYIFFLIEMFWKTRRSKIREIYIHKCTFTCKMTRYLRTVQYDLHKTWTLWHLVFLTNWQQRRRHNSTSRFCLKNSRSEKSRSPFFSTLWKLLIVMLLFAAQREYCIIDPVES